MNQENPLNTKTIYATIKLTVLIETDLPELDEANYSFDHPSIIDAEWIETTKGLPDIPSL
jgi:hypothetical protein